MYEVENPKHMINAENSFGMRPLYVACLHGHLEVVKLLVTYGADPHFLSYTNIDTKH
jgi:ankyrin repeat protein